MTQACKRLTNLIQNSVDFWAGFDPIEWRPTYQYNWDSEHEWFGAAIDELKPDLIIEVGSFLGKSAIHMAGKLKAAGLDSAVLCIDTWLAERQLWSRPEIRTALKFIHGRPNFYYSFLANVLDAGLTDYIVPMPMDSMSAASYLKDLQIDAPLIYIDGNHEAGEVYADLAAYWDRLRPGGIMLIDDYQPSKKPWHMYAGLVSDVNRFAKERSLTFEVQGVKARLRKV
jgi:predicted O-methyltransferase YrrM